MNPTEAFWIILEGFTSVLISQTNNSEHPSPNFSHLLWLPIPSDQMRRLKSNNSETISRESHERDEQCDHLKCHLRPRAKCKQCSYISREK